MATAYTAFLSKVSPEVGECPLVVQEDAVREAVIELCDKGWVWIYTHPAINSVANTGSYAFAPATGSLVSRVLQAWYEKRQLVAKTADQLAEMYANWTTETGTPLYMLQDNEASLVLVPKPVTAVAAAITARVTLRPTRASTDTEDRIYEYYLDVLAMGAKSKLMMMADKAWSNPKMAAAYKTMFDDAIGVARYNAQKGYGRAVRRVSGSYF